MKKYICICISVLLLVLSGCTGADNTAATTEKQTGTAAAVTEAVTEEETTEETTTEATTLPPPSASLLTPVQATEKLRQLENNLYISSYSGNYSFDRFLSNGGAKTDNELFTYLVSCVLTGKAGFNFRFGGAGCSTISVKGSDGCRYFGRNFDWKYCKALIMVARPSKGYSSVSTVNMGFITSSVSYELSDDVIRFCALYVPMDGMNEKGLCVSVNMIPGNAAIDQNTGKPDLTTTTAIRLMLDKAASVSEAVSLLKSYDMHASFGYNIHYAISDASGRSVAVEYINNRMVVTDTPVLTNFYVAKEKFGVGSKGSVKRYNILMDLLSEKETMNEWEVRDALSGVSKKNYNELEYPSTEWSIVFNQSGMNATYYHRENYSKGYKISLR